MRLLDLDGMHDQVEMPNSQNQCLAGALNSAIHKAAGFTASWLFSRSETDDRNVSSLEYICAY